MKYIKEYKNNVIDQVRLVVSHKLNVIYDELSFLKSVYTDDIFDMWTYVNFEVEGQKESHPFNDVELSFKDVDIDDHDFDELLGKGLEQDLLKCKMIITIDIETDRPRHLSSDFKLNDNKDLIEERLKFFDDIKSVFIKSEKLLEKYKNELEIEYKVDENEFWYQFKLIHDFNETYKLFKNMAS